METNAITSTFQTSLISCGIVTITITGMAAQKACGDDYAANKLSISQKMRTFAA